MDVVKAKLTLVTDATDVKAKIIVAAAIFWAAPCVAVVFPEHPKEEGRKAIILEVEGAPPAQAPRVGECLPTMG